MVVITKKLKKRYAVHTRYRSEDGTILPGNTTIVGGWGENKGTLMNWGWKMGLEGIDIYAYMNEMKKIGTLGHALIIGGLVGEKVDTNQYSTEQIDAAENAVLSWYEWQKNHEIEIILVETPMVSKEFLYGGTPDIYAKIDGKLEVTDIKTGSGIYESHYVQTVGYKQILEENGHKVEVIRIVNVPRTEDESFKEEIVKDVDIWWKIFKSLLNAYYEHKKIKPAYKKWGKKKIK